MPVWGDGSKYVNPFYQSVSATVRNELNTRADYYGRRVRGVGKAFPKNVVWSYQKTAWAHVVAKGSKGVKLGFAGSPLMSDRSGNLTMYSAARNVPKYPLLTGLEISNEGTIGSLLKGKFMFTIFPALSTSGFNMGALEEAFFTPGKEVEIAWGWSIAASSQAACSQKFTGIIFNFNWSLNPDLSVSADCSIVSAATIAMGLSGDQSSTKSGGGGGGGGSVSTSTPPSQGATGGAPATTPAAGAPSTQDPLQIPLEGNNLATVIDEDLADFIKPPTPPAAPAAAADPAAAAPVGTEAAPAAGAGTDAGMGVASAQVVSGPARGTVQYLAANGTKNGLLDYISVCLPFQPEPAPETLPQPNAMPAMAPMTGGDSSMMGGAVDPNAAAAGGAPVAGAPVVTPTTPPAQTESPEAVLKKAQVFGYKSVDEYKAAGWKPKIDDKELNKKVKYAGYKTFQEYAAAGFADSPTKPDVQTLKAQAFGYSSNEEYKKAGWKPKEGNDALNAKVTAAGWTSFQEWEDNAFQPNPAMATTNPALASGDPNASAGGGAMGTTGAPVATDPATGAPIDPAAAGQAAAVPAAPIDKNFWYVKLGAVVEFANKLISKLEAGNPALGNIFKVQVWGNETRYYADLQSAYPLDVLFPDEDMGTYGEIFPEYISSIKQGVRGGMINLGEILLGVDYVKETYRNFIDENSTNIPYKNITNFFDELVRKINIASGDIYQLTPVMCENPTSFAGSATIGGSGKPVDKAVLSIEDQNIGSSPSVKPFQFDATIFRPLIKNVSISCKPPAAMATAAYVEARGEVSPSNTDVSTAPASKKNAKFDEERAQAIKELNTLRNSAARTGFNETWGEGFRGSLIKVKRFTKGGAHWLEKAIYPIDLTITIDGVAGFKFGDVITTSLIPSRYKTQYKMVFTVTKINHTINSSGWETTLQTKARISM